VSTLKSLDWMEVRKQYRVREGVHRELLKLREEGNITRSLTFCLGFQSLRGISALPSTRWAQEYLPKTLTQLSGYVSL
jgi:hypothetical protein